MFNGLNTYKNPQKRNENRNLSIYIKQSKQNTI